MSFYLNTNSSSPKNLVKSKYSRPITLKLVCTETGMQQSLTFSSQLKNTRQEEAYVLMKLNRSRHQQKRAVAQVQIFTHFTIQLCQYFISKKKYKLYASVGSARDINTLTMSLEV